MQHSVRTTELEDLGVLNCLVVNLWAEIDPVCYLANGTKTQLLFAG